MLPKWKTIAFCVLLGLSLILAALKILNIPNAGSWLQLFQPDVSNIALVDATDQILWSYGIRSEWIKDDGKVRTVRVPADLLMVEPYVELTAAYTRLGAELLRAESTPEGNRMLLEVGQNDRTVIKLTLVKDERLKRAAGAIAIVVDGLGDSYDSSVQALVSLQQPITFSISPGLKHSKRIADQAYENDHGVAVHVPLQQQQSGSNGDVFSLKPGMEASEVRKRYRRSVSEIPHARGLMHYHESATDENTKMLAIVMEEVKRAGLYFLDSTMSPSAKVQDLAKKRDVLAAFSDIDLDKIKLPAYITQQLNRLAELAIEKGHAIGVAHPYDETIEVLKQKLPELEQRGFVFTTISEVAK